MGAEISAPCGPPLADTLAAATVGGKVGLGGKLLGKVLLRSFMDREMLEQS